MQKILSDISIHTGRFVAQNSKILMLTGLAMAALGALAISIVSAPIVLPIAGATVLAGALVASSVMIRYRHVIFYLTFAPILGAIGIPVGCKPFKEFEPRTHEWGRLYYDDNKKPILELTNNDPEKMGIAQGYILGESIEEVAFDVIGPLRFFSSLLCGDYSGKRLREGLKKVVIPEPFLKEIKGLAKGYKQFCQEKGRPFYDFTDDIILAHKLLDIYKSIGCRKIFGLPFYNNIGCTTIVQKKGDDMLVTRNLDWPSLDRAGRNMLEKRYFAPDGRKITVHTFPGVIHDLTAKSDRGLEVIINELGTTSVGGTPYGLIAREVIENCDSVASAEEYLKTHLPASSCHLTVVDRKTAANFQFHVDKVKPVIIRRLKENEALVVANHALDENGKVISGSEASITSHMRFRKATSAAKKGKSQARIAKAANVMETVGVVLSKNMQWRTFSGDYYAARFAT